MFIAMGVFALAETLEANGYSSGIIHLGVEKIVNSEFSIREYLRNHDVSVIGLSLHWHYQSSSCINLANEIKSINPKIKVILGGFTASFFAEEIMHDYKNVDFIIRGDAEIPLLGLMKEISEGRPDFSNVPNLSWRNNGLVVHNKQSYVATETDLDKLGFSNFNLLENFDIYSRVPIAMPCYSKEFLLGYSTFFLPVGRGCSVTCSFCGGSSLSQHIINSRETAIFSSHKNVLQSIIDAIGAGIDRLYVSFDPDPDREYYIELFRRCRENQLDISMVFECWSLPTIELIDEFKKTFGKGKYSKIVLSPETASDRLRLLNTGFFYTNSEFLDVIQYLKRNEIYIEVYFSYPLPYENNDDRDAAIQFVERVKQELRNCGSVFIQDFDLDPASPMYLCPASYGIVRKVKGFSDYCRTEPARKFLPENLDEKAFKNAYQKWLHLSAAEEMLSYGRAYFTLKQYEEAIVKAREVIKLVPKEIGAYLLLGASYEQTNRYDDALDAYREALKVSPDEGTVYQHLANTYFTLGQYEKAIDTANKTIELGFDEGRIHLLLGSCYENIRHYEKAIKYLRKAAERFPDEYYLYFSLSDCYKKTGQIEQANKELEKGYFKLKKPEKIPPP